MKRCFFVIVVLLLAYSAMAQDVNRTDAKGLRQGVWMDFYPNGQKRYEGQFKNGKCKGEFRYYDEQGNLKATNTFDKSGEKALNKTYAPNGQLVATGYYVNQQKEGEWKYYDKDSGQLLLCEENKAGKVHGWSRLYNPNNGKCIINAFLNKKYIGQFDGIFMDDEFEDDEGNTHGVQSFNGIFKSVNGSKLDFHFHFD